MGKKFKDKIEKEIVEEIKQDEIKIEKTDRELLLDEVTTFYNDVLKGRSTFTVDVSRQANNYYSRLTGKPSQNVYCSSCLINVIRTIEANVMNNYK